MRTSIRGSVLTDRALTSVPRAPILANPWVRARSEEHTSELQSQSNLVCRLLLEKKKKKVSNDVRPLLIGNFNLVSIGANLCITNDEPHRKAAAVHCSVSFRYIVNNCVLYDMIN